MDKFDFCLCISAGLDSFTAYWLYKSRYLNKKICLLNVKTDSAYSEKEDKQVLKLYKDSPFPRFDVSMKGYEAVSSTDTHVVLGRNMMLASIAAGLAPNILICSTAFENNYRMYDKDSNFFREATRALTQACFYSRFGSTRVYSPYHLKFSPLDLFLGDFDKVEMIRILQREKAPWRKTITCFDSELLRCGRCAVCGKRFIYEAYCEIEFGIHFKKGVDLRKTYKYDPLNNEHLWETYRKMRQAKADRNFLEYPLKRIAIYETVIGHYEKIKSER
jgi:7-cyano-7-deazaguanine synthase in queuosine biosynthesis